MSSHTDDWRYRRRAVFAALAWAAILVPLVWASGRTDELSTDLIEAVTTAATIVLVTYIGVPVVDDWLRRRERAAPTMLPGGEPEARP